MRDMSSRIDLEVGEKQFACKTHSSIDTILRLYSRLQLIWIINQFLGRYLSDFMRGIFKGSCKYELSRKLPMQIFKKDS